MPLEQLNWVELAAKWSAFWERHQLFHSEPDPDKTPFSMVIPPPNVTGALHLGHALNGTLQDVIARWRRMQGYETLWMPGADHAGIATQAVVEKRIFEQEKKSRHDLGRDELVRRIWLWKDEYEARIISQLKAIGSSCDWSRWRFTLDDQCARAVRHAFFHMFKAGLIYRGKRLVNWDVQLQTAVADDEVYHDEVKGHLWRFLYPVEGSDARLEIATTRPETMLGDTAVAVHPDDPRYRPLIGQQVRLPLVDRLIPIVGDAELVDPEFGTGVVKVTPAHDPNDYQCGLRHQLPMINILSPDGTINAHGGPYHGLKREEARRRIVADLEALGLVSKIEPHRHAVGHSDRSKTAIEPYLSDQWFVRMPDLAERAMTLVRDGKITFHPARYADSYLSWLGEKRDWCVSRQLWWGHQIPIWYTTTATKADLDAAFAGRTEIAIQRDEEQGQWLICALEDLDADAVPGHALTRDPDVLDTWFSSALWPHSTMGWPEKTKELEYYYPTRLLSTAREIISLWVARMVIMSDFNLQQVPFTDVFVHPVIQDGQGMPMKKSLGNGVDPFDIIAKYGPDALRYTLVAMTTETQDVRMPVKKETLPDGKTVNVSEKFELGRNFATKIFNAAKLILSQLEGMAPGPLNVSSLPLEDRWILCRTSRAIRSVTASLEGYDFAGVGKQLHEFIWGDLCDWHLELAKPRLRGEGASTEGAQRVLAAVLDRTVRLLHPVMPFLSEEIWRALGESTGRPGARESSARDACCVAPWPTPEHDWEADRDVERRMTLLQDVVRAVRNIRSQFALPPKASLTAHVDAEPAEVDLIQENSAAIMTLANVGELVVGSGQNRPAQSAAHVLAQCKVYVPLAEHIDVGAETAKQRKRREELQHRLRSVSAKLANQEFVDRAPADVVAQHRQSEADLLRQLTDIDAILVELSSSS